MNKITGDMLSDFNETMNNAGSSIRLIKSNSDDGVYYIRLVEDPYIDEDSRVVYPARHFYKELEMYFESKGIKKINYNNTKTAFWWI